MSVKAYCLVMRDRKITPLQKFVLSVMADGCDENHETISNPEYVAIKTNLHVREVEEIVNRSIEQGLLQIVKQQVHYKGGERTLRPAYRFNFEKIGGDL
jgi:hypothetical protein